MGRRKLFYTNFAAENRCIAQRDVVRQIHLKTRVNGNIGLVENFSARSLSGPGPPKSRDT